MLARPYDQEWVDQIKASYVPLQLDEGLWVVPDWSEPVDRGAINIVLQPGVACAGNKQHKPGAAPTPPLPPRRLRARRRCCVHSRSWRV